MVDEGMRGNVRKGKVLVKEAEKERREEGKGRAFIIFHGREDPRNCSTVLSYRSQCKEGKKNFFSDRLHGGDICWASYKCSFVTRVLRMVGDVHIGRCMLPRPGPSNYPRKHAY